MEEGGFCLPPFLPERRINMGFWEKIKDHNLRLLAAQANANGGNAEPTIDSVLGNLNCLSETVQSYGEDKKILRLSIRRTLGTLCDTGRILFRVEPESIRWGKDNSSLSLGGYLYEIREDGTEIRISSFAAGGCAKEDIFPRDMMTDSQREALMLYTASARAESNALYNAGIGVEYKGGDVFDLEALDAAAPAAEPVMPSPASKEEKKQKKAAKAKKEIETAKTVEEPVVATDAEAEKPVVETAVNVAEVADPVEEDVVTKTQTASDETTANTSKVLSYEEALNMVVDCGAHAGKTIGEILSKPQTARNIVWCYKQEPEGRTEDTKKALWTAIEGYSDGVLKKFL